MELWGLGTKWKGKTGFLKEKKSEWMNNRQKLTL